MTKNVWITGASSGIGKALAIKFANEGWQVAASARRENLLQDLNKNNPNINSFLYGNNVFLFIPKYFFLVFKMSFSTKHATGLLFR